MNLKIIAIFCIGFVRCGTIALGIITGDGCYCAINFKEKDLLIIVLPNEMINTSLGVIISVQ